MVTARFVRGAGRVTARFVRGAGVAAALTAAMVVASGCASYSQHALPVREPLARGDLAAAEAFLVEKKPGGAGLPYLMELGLILRYQGEYARSNETFDAAELLVEELFTKSISREVMSLVTNDEMRDYAGEMWERALVHYYRALNYIDLAEYDEALVECRKLNQRLAVYADATNDGKTYRNDAFAQYLTAILYEVGGDTGDAWVSLRLADDAYAHYERAYGTPPPASLQRDLIRLAQSQGFTDEETRYRKRFSGADAITTEELLKHGEIVLFWEEGFIPAKIQVDATIPILKDADEQDRSLMAVSLRERYYHPRPYQKKELKYLLRFALPAYAPPLPDEMPGWCELGNGAVRARSELAENLAAIARRGLDDRMGNILLRSIVRALGKYALTAAAENNKGEVAGRLVNFLTAASEKADTRSWITLPKTIQITRLLVDPGVHQLELKCYDARGDLVDSVVFDDVRVDAGQVRFLSHRSF